MAGFELGGEDTVVIPGGGGGASSLNGGIADNEPTVVVPESGGDADPLPGGMAGNEPTAALPESGGDADSLTGGMAGNEPTDGTGMGGQWAHQGGDAAWSGHLTLGGENTVPTAGEAQSPLHGGIESMALTGGAMRASEVDEAAGYAGFVGGGFWTWVNDRRDGWRHRFDRRCFI